MNARVKRAPILVALAALAGCLPARRPDRAGMAFWRKPVAEKRAPVHLIAADQSTCVVSEEKFREVEVGEGVWCWWREADEPGVVGETIATGR